MRYSILHYFFILLLMINLMLSTVSDAQAKVENKTLVMIIIDKINIGDLKDNFPNLNKIIRNSSVGLMNIRNARRYEATSSYLTIGSGTRAYANSNSKNMVFSSGEKYQDLRAGKLFENITGHHVDKENIVVLDIPKLILENKKQDYEVLPGLLGKRLKEGNIPVTLLGNCDSFLERNRPAGLIVMDDKGIIAKGEINKSLLIEDINSAFSIKTDYEKLFQRFISYKKQGGLLVIQLGDLVRADDYHKFVSEKRYDFFRKRALKEADLFLGEVYNSLDFSKDMLMVVSPSPSIRGYQRKDLLTPLIIKGPETEPGLCISATTRRKGLVTSIDIAPTILKFFNLPKPGVMLGQSITSKGEKNSLEYLINMNEKIINVYIQRAYLIKPFVALQIFISLIFLLLFITKKNYLKYLKPFIFAGMSIPLILLFLTKVALNSLLSKYIWLFIFLFLIVFVNLKFKDSLFSIILISLTTGGAVLIDLLLGAPLMKTSVLGYDPIGGSRYYGLGNEYMGVLIGSLNIGLMAFLDKFNNKRILKYLVIFQFIIAFYLIASPGFGSNVGGTISSIGAFSIIILLIFKQKIKLMDLTKIGFSIFFILLLLFVISPYYPHSHISQTLSLIKEGGIKTLLLIFSRKLTMNYKLFKYTVWSRALLTSIGVIVLLLFKPPYLLKKIFSKYNNLYNGFIGTGVGCFLALIFNDSGIVASATMILYVALPIFLLVIDETTELG